jgi:hypothetical protein
VIQQWYQAADVCSGGVCSATPATTLAGGAHTWWIQPWNPTDGYGPWSAGMNFNTTVPTPPAAATLTSPTGNIGTNYSPDFVWSVPASGSAPTWYYLYISGPSGKVLDKWYEASAICSSGTCTVVAPVTLGGGAHTWWVQTYNSAGYGPWSSSMSFSTSTVLPGAATLLSPNGSLGSNHNPTYRWNEVAGASYYYLWVNGPSGNVIQQWYQASVVCSGGTCSITPAVTLANGAHTWWIQTWNGAGYGPWSAGMTFTPGAAILTAPTGTISTHTPTYSWNEVTGMTWYYLWVNGPSGNVIKQWYEASTVCSGGTCSVTPATTLASGAHTWWIQTWNSSGYGPWSSAMNFVTP